MVCLSVGRGGFLPLLIFHMYIPPTTAKGQFIKAARVCFCSRVAMVVVAFVAAEESFNMFAVGFMGKTRGRNECNSGVVFSGKWNFLCVCGKEVRDFDGFWVFNSKSATVTFLKFTLVFTNKSVACRFSL